MPPFEQFYRDTQDRVWRLLRRLVGPAADDCFQETFLAAMRNYDNLKTSDNLEGWILTIARSKAVDHWRKEARQPLPSESVLYAVDQQAAPESWPSGDEGDVWESVESLPAKQRQAVTLRFAGDLSHAEIAAVMGVSPEAARKNLSQALQTLRRSHAYA
jgi:RNA polymerase sigma factor (sigma-70 family)